MSKSGIGMDVHSLMLSVQHFLCKPQCHTPTPQVGDIEVSRGMVARACSNHNPNMQLQAASYTVTLMKSLATLAAEAGDSDLTCCATCQV